MNAYGSTGDEPPEPSARLGPASRAETAGEPSREAGPSDLRARSALNWGERGPLSPAPPPSRAWSSERPTSLDLTTAAHPDDPAWRQTLEGWLRATDTLERWPLPPDALLKLADGRRICEELRGVLAGHQPGEGCAAERTLHVASAAGRVQGLCAMFACPGGTFVELLVTAPWNLVGPAAPREQCPQRGVGTALVARAADWSARRGCGGRVALQAENPRTLRFYERLGFRRLVAADGPLQLVPRGDHGWSPEILRVAAGTPGPEEERMPWLLRDAAPALAIPAWRSSPAA